MPKVTKTERAEQIARLRKWLSPGDTVFTVLDSVSRSGMQRQIRLVVLKCEDGKVIDLHPNYAAACVLGWPQDKRRDGIKVRGCGMDMGFHLVYELAAAMFGDGYALKQRWL